MILNLVKLVTFTKYLVKKSEVYEVYEVMHEIS